MEGVVLADQVQSVAWRLRAVKYEEPAPEQLLDEVVARIAALIAP